MKKLAFILMAAVVMIGCKKSEINNEAPPLTSPGMVAKIGGTAIDYGVPMGERQVSTDGTETVFIGGYKMDGNSIYISLSKQGGITPGTYGVTNAALINIGDGTSSYSTVNNVSIKITSADASHLVGSFSGTAQEDGGTSTKTITEGRFYVEF